MSVPQKQSSYIGRRFNHLVVLSVIREDCTCQCDCGKITVVRQNNLYTGNTKSCGCRRFHPERFRVQNEVWALRKIAKNKERRFRHRALHNVWRSMKRRCQLPSHVDYRFYGARGISVCPEWNKDFYLFQEWARQSGYRRGLEIDRIDNDKGYSPENCRIVTKAENLKNRRKPQFTKK